MGSTVYEKKLAYAPFPVHCFLRFFIIIRRPLCPRPSGGQRPYEKELDFLASHPAGAKGNDLR